MKGAWDGSQSSGNTGAAWWLQVYDLQAELWVDSAVGLGKGDHFGRSAMNAEMVGALKLTQAAALVAIGTKLFSEDRLVMAVKTTEAFTLSNGASSFVKSEVSERLWRMFHRLAMIYFHDFDPPEHCQ